MHMFGILFAYKGLVYTLLTVDLNRYNCDTDQQEE
jgi:hypothetical protein